jgi:hypothetical protein
MDNSESEVVVVARFHYRHEAELALGYLESAGINAALFMDDAGGSQVGMAFVRPGRLVVGLEDWTDAVEVLEGAGYGDRLEG